MPNFYPGPSKLYPQIAKYAEEAFSSGILEQNHRSVSFMALLEETIDLFKKKLAIPQDYSVFFTSSATESWEIVAQSLLRGNIQFLYNGAFGKKWFKYTVTNPVLDKVKTLPNIRGSRFHVDQLLSELEIDQTADFICLVQNETSNGTEISNEELKKLPKDCIKCLDVTSGIGGEYIAFGLGDVWLASTQKCLGLPSGLGLLICSPKAMEAAKSVNERNHYNSLLFIAENFQQFQTHYTPNILNIFLLNRLMRDLEGIQQIDKKQKDRALDFYTFIENNTKLNILSNNNLCRSNTVLTIFGESINIARINEKAKEKEIILGNGYGEWKENTFRVANFPAINNQEFAFLKDFLSQI